MRKMSDRGAQGLNPLSNWPWEVALQLLLGVCFRAPSIIIGVTVHLTYKGDYK